MNIDYNLKLSLEFERMFFMKLSYKERINNVKPIVVVSRCLGFEACRYNGQMDGCNLVEKLKDFVDFITVCPRFK